MTELQKARIIKLYKDGETFRRALAANPNKAQRERGIYQAVAALGQLRRNQARSFFQEFCNPPDKPCRDVITQIAQEVDVSTEEVEETLREYFE